jgi:PAS domain S-box-containing protein
VGAKKSFARQGRVAFDEVFGAEAPHRVGSFRYLLHEDRWEWSDTVAAMHGYAPGTVAPTTELLLSHKHPEDRAKVAAILTNLLDSGQPFSSRHRIVDAQGRVRQVIVVGHTLTDRDGRVVGTGGFYVDVTESVQAEVRQRVSNALEKLTASRACIEQAKGILMFVYGIDAERAFDILTWRSQETNIKVKDLAKQLLDDVAHHHSVREELRAEFDSLLLTGHLRAAQPGR